MSDQRDDLHTCTCGGALVEIRDEVDIGVGVQYGPIMGMECTKCGLIQDVSENPRNKFDTFSWEDDDEKQ